MLPFTNIILHICMTMFVVMPVCKLYGQDIAIGQWRSHLPYRNAKQVVNTPDKIYCLANTTFYSFNKSDWALTPYDKTNGLSDVNGNTIGYSHSQGVLLVAYRNANIDLIADDGKVTNISAIKQDDITGDKKIYEVHFMDESAFLATGFGIVNLNIADNEVQETYFIGDEGQAIQVNDITNYNGKLFAATENGLKTAPLNAPNLVDFRTWTHQTYANKALSAESAAHLATFDQKVYASLQDTLFRYNGEKWQKAYFDSSVTIRNLDTSSNHLLISTTYTDTTGSLAGGNVLKIDSTGQLDTLIDENTFFPKQATIENDGTIWVADLYAGLKRIQEKSVDNIYPNGPYSTNLRKITAENGKVWVAPGGVNDAWNYTYNNDGFYSYEKGSWTNYNQFNTPALDTMLNIIDVAVRPSDNAAFFASYYEGLVEFNNGEVTAHDPTNSSLQGFNPVPFRTRVSGVAIDSEENLWVANFGATRPISAMKPDGTWQAFGGNENIDGNSVADVVVDERDQVWFRVVKSSSQAIVVLNHGGTIEDQSDDVYGILGQGEGNDGLPTNNVKSMAKDKDGEIWVGTSEGIAVFYCASQVLTERGCDAERILVEQGQYTGYLLEDEQVNTITVDAANRKWVGTNNGVWLFSEDGKEVIHNFTADNSPLLSDVVLDIGINDETGEVFIGTSRGMVSYRGEAVGGEDTHQDVYVYPNPVRENYSGKIAIKGLVDNAFVKITDVSGKLVYEGRATGGQIVWDGADYNGHQASPGVYLVYSSNDAKDESFVTKFVIMQ